jgi:hypothetical protein
MGASHRLGRLSLAMLDRTRRQDYLYVALYGLIPSAMAIYLGAGSPIEADGVVYAGWFEAYNFWPFFALIPFVLWLLRLTFARMVHVTPARVPDELPPPVLGLFRHNPDRQAVYELLRDWIASPKLMGLTLASSLVVNAIDVSEMVLIYLDRSAIRAGEFDWSVMYQIGVMSKPANALFCVLAYGLQFMIITLGIWCLAVLIAHNLFFVRHVYQRSRVAPGEEKNCITLELDDVDRCFGFRAADEGFSTQVIVLSVIGAFILLSRFSNVGNVADNVRLDELILGSNEVPLDGFPDVGQSMLALSWVVVLCIITTPLLVKLLPRLPGYAKLAELNLEAYLREFLTPQQWTFGERPSAKQINLLAARFANNYFWPTGDNRASSIFFVGFWVFLIILYPVKTDDFRILVPSVLFLGALAWGMRSLLFRFLESTLSYVDERLVLRQPDLLAQADDEVIRIRGKVFISYRREDSLAYARLLRQSLAPHIEQENLFMDLETIRDGQDFVDVIEAAIDGCESLVVVIGQDWSGCADEQGRRRLDQADDFVRLEIGTALALGKRVVPVLVGGAAMPGAEELPGDIALLWRRQARELSDSRWEYDVGELARALADSD